MRIAEKRYLRTDMQGKVIETPGQMFLRVAQYLAKAEINWGSNGVVEKTAAAFFERMVNFKFVVAGKAMFEAGNPGGTGQLSSCFVLPIEDDMKQIFKTLGDAALVHKNNGGTGFNFSHIRPRGDKVKNVPHAASGPVDFLSAYSAALARILQGSKRQGANIGILNVDHPDIIGFITLKDEDGTIKNFNISVGITDAFMEAVDRGRIWELKNPRNGEVWQKIKARKLFDLIAQHAWATGDPGLAFLDRMEVDNPTPSIGKIEATNPCITGEALITSDKGLVRFDQLKPENKILVDKRVISGNGVMFADPLKVIKRGKKEVYRVVTRSGFSLNVTKDHKVLTTNGWKQITDLKPGDHVLIQSREGSFSKVYDLPFKVKPFAKGDNGKRYHHHLPRRWNQKLGQLLGWLVGDGFIRDYKKDGKSGSLICLTFGKSKKEASSYFYELFNDWFGEGVRLFYPNGRSVQVRKQSRFVVGYLMKLGLVDSHSENKVIPESIFTAPRISIVGFLQGLFSSDGTVGFVKGKSAYIRLTSKSEKLLQETQLLLLNFGIKARIYDRSRRVRKKLFPEYVNAKGEHKRYSSDGKLWELEISKDGVPVFLKKIGFMFSMHQEKIKELESKTYYKTRFYDEVREIAKLGKEEVFDLIEPKTHSFIANGFVVHNCGEIPLLPYESCNLTSIVLSNHLKKQPATSSQQPGRKNKKTGNWRLAAGSYAIDWDDLEKSVKLGIRLLDNMIEVNAYPVPEIEQMVKHGNRRIGLGVMGFAHLLYKLEIPYNSAEAVRLSERLAKFIRRKAEEESLKLGKERGAFPNWDRSIYAGTAERYRNCALTMIAPTGTTSMLADTSSGIEPVFSLVTLRRTFFEDDRSNRPTKELVMVDPVFEEFLNARIKKQELISKIMERAIHDGSLKNVKELTPKEKRVFVTTHQIAPEWHVKIQAAWQKHFDNSVSKTINFPAQALVEDVKKAYRLAWKLGCKGITIYRDGSKQDQVLNITGSRQPAAGSRKKTKQELATGDWRLATDSCPECHSSDVVIAEGCMTCKTCGWSKCTL